MEHYDWVEGIILPDSDWSVSFIMCEDHFEPILTILNHIQPIYWFEPLFPNLGARWHLSHFFFITGTQIWSVWASCIGIYAILVFCQKSRELP